MGTRDMVIVRRYISVFGLSCTFSSTLIWGELKRRLLSAEKHHYQSLLGIINQVFVKLLPVLIEKDSSIGWYHFLAGLTLYYSDPTEGTLDELYSISMPPGAVPM